MIRCLTAAIVVGVASCQRLFLEKNLALPISGVVIQNSLVSRVDILWSIDKSNMLKGQYQMMTLDMTSDSIIAMNKTNDTFYGLLCNDETRCVQSNDTTAVQYGINQLNCSNSSTLARFQEIALPQDFKTTGLSFMLCNETKTWKMNVGQGGVLGLNSNSSFWRYITEQYKMADNNKIMIGLSYKVKYEDSMLPDKSAELVNSFLIVNGQYSTAKAVMQPYRNTKNRLWTASGIDVFLTDDYHHINSTLCIDNKAAYFIMMQPFTYTRVMADFNIQLCGKKDGCYFSNSNLPNVKNFRIIIYQQDNEPEFSVSLTADDLVKFDKSGKPFYGFGDISQSECSYIENGFAVGRWFMTKAELLIEVDSDMNFRVGFAPLFNETKSRAVLIIILISLLSLFLLGILVIIAINFLPRCWSKKDDYTLTDAKVEDN
jgi:hypothetical protein